MRDIKGLKLVTIDNFHEVIPTFISANKIIIDTFEDMQDVFLRMIKSRFIFTIDREILLCLLVDLTYMYNPEDDLNKERVLNLLFEEDDDDDDDMDASNFDLSSILSSNMAEAMVNNNDVTDIVDEIDNIKE